MVIIPQLMTDTFILFQTQNFKIMTYTYQYHTNPDGSKSIQRKEDMAFIPEDLNNKDWVEYQEWVAAGNTATEA